LTLVNGARLARTTADTAHWIADAHRGTASNPIAVEARNALCRRRLRAGSVSMRASIAIASFVTGMLLASCALAHDTWLLPHAPGRDRAQWTLDLTTGHDFPAPEHAPSSARVRRAEAIAATATLPLLPRTARKDALPFGVLVEREAVVAAVVGLRQTTTTLDDAAVDRYLAGELGEWPALRERHRRLGHWRERYTKNAKALLRIGDGGDSGGVASRAHGLPYELMPRTDPTRRAPGDPLVVCAFADGAPVRNPFVPLRVGLVEADGRATWQVAGDDGCATVRPATTDGYLLRSVLIRPLDAPHADWDSHFATLTVGSATARPSTPAEESSR
jgi:hypothetical protein